MRDTNSGVGPVERGGLELLDQECKSPHVSSATFHLLGVIGEKNVPIEPAEIRECDLSFSGL